jgi:hypothetical protein
MELTNLIWHLGAALAALWAGLAYRSLSARYAEVRESVLPSVLQVHKTESGESTAFVLPAQERSSRVRALRWMVTEFARNYGVECTVGEQQTLLSVGRTQWARAVAQLFECSQGPSRLPPSPFWLDEKGGRISASAFAEALNQFKMQGQIIVLNWNEAAFEGQGGWQWRVS